MRPALSRPSSAGHAARPRREHLQWRRLTAPLGLCFEKKGEISSNHDVGSTRFSAGTCGSTTVVQEIDCGAKIDELKSICPKLVNRAFQACGNNKKDANDCVFDIIEGCTAIKGKGVLPASQNMAKHRCLLSGEKM